MTTSRSEGGAAIVFWCDRLKRWMNWREWILTRTVSELVGGADGMRKWAEMRAAEPHPKAPPTKREREQREKMERYKEVMGKVAG
jgi:hypothetical protein